MNEKPERSLKFVVYRDGEKFIAELHGDEDLMISDSKKATISEVREISFKLEDDNVWQIWFGLR